MMTYYLLQLGAIILILGSLVYLAILLKIHTGIYSYMRGLSIRVWSVITIIVIAGGVLFYASHPYPLDFAMPPMMHSMAPGGMPASIPFLNALEFLFRINKFEQV